jgi:hypothetical protein
MSAKNFFRCFRRMNHSYHELLALYPLSFTLYPLPFILLTYSQHHFPRQTIHPRKRKPTFAKVFDGCADVIEFFSINQQKAIVHVFEAVKPDGRILFVVFVNVELNRCRYSLGVYVCGNVRSAFG